MRSTRSARSTAAYDELTHEISSLQGIFDDLANLSAGFKNAVAAPPGRPAESADLAVLRPLIFATIRAHHGLVTGAGVICAPGLLADAPRWVEWWWTATGGDPEALRVNLDDSTPDFFDYTAAEWYAVPMSEPGPHAAGPYVDFFCTNEYTITFARAVPGPRPLGIAAADVLVSELEKRIAPILVNLGGHAVLTNLDGRVIASANVNAAPGDLIDVNRVDTEILGGSDAHGSRTGFNCLLIREL